MILSCLNCFSDIYFMHILLNHWNNTTDKNDDTSEGMPTPHPKINESVGREGEEDKSGGDSNKKVFFNCLNIVLWVVNPELVSLQFGCSSMLLCLCRACVMLMLWFCCASIMFISWLCYASSMLLLCLCYVDVTVAVTVYVNTVVTVLLCFCYPSTETKF